MAVEIPILNLIENDMVGVTFGDNGLVLTKDSVLTKFYSSGQKMTIFFLSEGGSQGYGRPHSFRAVVTEVPPSGKLFSEY